MTTKATKIELLDWLSGIEDDAVLAALLFYKKANESTDWADDLTEGQRAAIREGLEDVRQGREHPSAEVWNRCGR
jgi:hypothetical protein